MAARSGTEGTSAATWGGVAIDGRVIDSRIAGIQRFGRRRVNPGRRFVAVSPAPTFADMRMQFDYDRFRDGRYVLISRIFHHPEPIAA